MHSSSAQPVAHGQCRQTAGTAPRTTAAPSSARTYCDPAAISTDCDPAAISTVESEVRQMKTSTGVQAGVNPWIA